MSEAEMAYFNIVLPIAIEVLDFQAVTITVLLYSSGSL